MVAQLVSPTEPVVGMFLPKSLADAGWTETDAGGEYVIAHPDGRKAMSIRNGQPSGFHNLLAKDITAAIKVISDANRERFDRAFETDNRDENGHIRNELGPFSRVLFSIAQKTELKKKTPYRIDLTSATEATLTIGPRRSADRMTWCVGPDVRRPYILIHKDKSGSMQRIVDAILPDCPWLIQAGGTA